MTQPPPDTIEAALAEQWDAEPACIACERGQGPFSLHHFDSDGCHGTFGGATFTLERNPDPQNHSLIVRRIEPVKPAPEARPSGATAEGV
jgi:hypothetical protein